MSTQGPEDIPLGTCDHGSCLVLPHIYNLSRIVVTDFHIFSGKVEKTVPYGLGLNGHSVKKYVKFQFHVVSHTL